MKKPIARILSLFISLHASVCAAASPDPDKLNVLLFAVDDLKPLLGCYGDPRVQTPNIDRLAKRGMLFERAYCNQAVCAPSRNALLTGLRPDTLGIYDLATFFRQGSRPDAVTLPQLLKSKGYRSESLGKLFHTGHGNGDDEKLSWSSRPWRPGGEYALAGNAGKKPAVEIADVPDNRYSDGKTADEAIRRLDLAQADPATPFFLAVGFLKPHLPFAAPEKYWNIYQRADFKPHALQSPPEGAPAMAATDWGELRQYDGIPRGELSLDQQMELIHGYHAAVSYMDAQLGKVLDHLEKSPLAGRTVVVLWGDHGWHLGDHGFWCKHTNYEQAARVPLIIAGPSIKPGKTPALTQTVDIYPTICQLINVTPPADLDGKSILPTLLDPSVPANDHAFHVYPRGRHIGRAIRTDRHRMVEWKIPGEAKETAEIELYDYQVDPAETRNLAKDQPEVVAKLRELLDRYPEAKPQVRMGKPQAKVEAAKPKSGTDRHALFRRRDQNQNGELTLEEFMTHQPDPTEAAKRFPRFDTDQNGVLSVDEFVGKTRN